MIGKLAHWETYGENGNITVEDCNQFYMTVRGENYKKCFPLDWVTISFDPNNQRPHLYVSSREAEVWFLIGSALI
jgi:hypothetical protein